jgi:Flp pilus assembly protein TadD
MQGRDAEALAALRRALALEPRNPDTHEVLAAVLERQGAGGEAARHRREAAALRSRQ